MALATPKDTQWKRWGVKDESITTMEAVAVIVHALTKPQGSTSIEDVAKETGFSEMKIREVLNSPQYADLLADHARRLVAPLLVKSLRAFSDLVERDNLKVHERIAVNRELRQTWRDLHELVPEQNDDEKAARAFAELRLLTEKRAITTDSPVTIEACSEHTEPRSSSSST